MKKRVLKAPARFARLSLLLLMATLVLTASAAYAGRTSTVDIPVQEDLYAVTPVPLSPGQCAQCHNSVFGGLKKSGGKHRFDCQQCHQVIHSYSPKKANWDELMPKCSSCHSDIHGPANKDCSSCHANPHTPGKVAMTQRLTSACVSCHAAPKADLVKFPSKHSKVSCEKCHTSHGFKPSCFACHKPHYRDQEIKTCAKCHPVHKPKQVTYENTEPALTCGSCHTQVFAQWTKTPSLHSKVNCAVCHKTSHGYIPQCTECHKAPHPKSILDRFPKCLDCHLDVHDLPTVK